MGEITPKNEGGFPWKIVENCDASFPTAKHCLGTEGSKLSQTNQLDFCLTELVHSVHDSNSIFFNVRSGMLLEYSP